jgi:hypothetical protein
MTSMNALAHKQFDWPPPPAYNSHHNSKMRSFINALVSF